MKRAGLLTATVLALALPTFQSAALIGSTVNDALNLPRLGDTTSGIISQQEEYELGRSWLKVLRHQTPTLPDPQLKDYLENLIYRLGLGQPITRPSTCTSHHQQPCPQCLRRSGRYYWCEYRPVPQCRYRSPVCRRLAHELAHLSQRHYARNVEEARNKSIPNAAAILGSILIMATAGSDAGAAALTSTMAGIKSAQLRFSRQFEREADNIGITTLVSAGFDPQAMPEIFEHMHKASRFGSRPPEFLLTHPVTENRISDSRARADQISAQKLLTTKGSLNYQLMRVRALVLNSNNPNELARQMGKEISAGSAAPGTRYAMAMASLKARDFKTAQQQTELLLKKHPDNIYLIMLQATVESATGKAKAGLARIDRALGINPDNYPLLATRAEILLQQQNFSEAQKTLQSLSRMRPEDPDIWFELAEAQGLAKDIMGLHQSRAEYFFLNGNTDDAIKHLQYAVKMAGDNFALKSKLLKKLSDMQKYQQKLRNS